MVRETRATLTEADQNRPLFWRGELLLYLSSPLLKTIRRRTASTKAMGDPSKARHVCPKTTGRNLTGHGATFGNNLTVPHPFTTKEHALTRVSRRETMGLS